MKDASTPCPGNYPLVLVKMDTVDIGNLQQRGDCGLFFGLSGQEVCGRLREDDAYGDIRIRGQSSCNERQLDGRHATTVQG